MCRDLSTTLIVAYILVLSPLVLDALPPAPPAELRAWPTSESTIQLEWVDRADDESAYEVYRRTGRTGNWSLVAESLEPDSIRYTDAGLDPGSFCQYLVLARNADGVSSSPFAQAITDDGPFGLRSLSFQDGMGTYSGTRDIGIQETDPTSGKTTTYVWIDNNGAEGDSQALLNFTGIFGDEPDRVPEHAVITRALLRLYLGTNDNAQTYKPITFHQMFVPWDTGTSWNAPGLGGDGVQLDDVEARADDDAFCVFPNPGDYYEVDVTPSVQAWAAGEEQYGWVLRSKYGDGYAFYTSHNPVVSQRPELIVSYDTDPGNAAPGIEQIISPAPDASVIHEPAMLKFEVADPDGDPMDVTIFGRQVPASDEPDFRVVLLPDTQYYCAGKNGGMPEMFYSQVDWIIENLEVLNIQFVLHMGDIVQSGDLKSGAQNTQEWVIAAQAMYRMHVPTTTGLPEGLPFAVNVGNHDQEPRWHSSGTTRYFNRFFGADHFEKYSYYGGNYGENNDNHFYLFKVGSHDFIVISLEYSDPALDPVDPNLLEWADALLKQYPEHRGIVISHHMISPGTPGAWSPYGEVLYEALKDNPNLHFMLGGHIPGEGLRVGSFQGNTTYALLQDYQALPLGGSGFLRILTFSPGRNEVRLETYSPWLDEYLEEYGGSYSLSYDMGTDVDPFTELAHFENVENPSLQQFQWQELEPDTEYEWFLQVGDGRKNRTGEVHRFRTASRTYSSWRKQYFSIEDPAGEASNDPDGDGFSNEMEFVYNGNPTVAGPLQVPVDAVVYEERTTKFIYERFSIPGITWNYEVSSDVLTWTDAGQSGILLDEVVEGLGNGMERVHLTIENAEAGPVFLRIHSRISD